MVLNADSISLSLYGGGKLVFSDISLELGEGEIALAAGGSGSGKTVLGLTLCGFLPIWAGSWELDGRIEFLGESLTQGDTPLEIGIILENPYTQLSGIKRSVRQELAFPLECRGIKPKDMQSRIELYAGLLGVQHLLDRSVRTLSGGELQRVLVECALIAQPRFLFLDRPLTEIDTEFRPALMNIVRQHLDEQQGAALAAEDPWLLPESLHFDKICSLDEDIERGVNTADDWPSGQYAEHKANDESVLVVDSLAYGYNDSNPVISDLSFSLGKGELIFITGENGSGKTTLARLLAGVLTPESGTIVIDGRRAGAMAEWEQMSAVGYALQNPGFHLSRSTVREELELSKRWGNSPGELIEVLGLDTLLENHPLELTQAEKKRLGMALSCGEKRKVIILDEPSQYQDSSGFRRILDALSMCLAEGMGVLVITHDPRFFRVFPGAEIIRLSREASS